MQLTEATLGDVHGWKNLGFFENVLGL